MTGHRSLHVLLFNGVFVTAASKRLPATVMTLMTEAKALRAVVRLIDPGDQRAVVAETDSLELVSLWKSMGKYRSQFTLVHVSRSVATHLCAKFASRDRGSQVWVQEPPSFLLL
ncbi:hypothetical protein HU200_001685 [Digitaria exilis]|uniref:RNase H type-1 domain-containing protein n=1 Tax=Digitaria exilis TaxID=1010633 RepID=A0A835KUU5_9POAL|nr:hypothetical protein HU200_001685 [Digitaria exilis]